MSSADMHIVTIDCEAPDQGPSHRATVQVLFGPIDRDHVSSGVRLRLRDWECEGESTFYGMDIFRFADELAELHRRTDGSARLVDCDGEPVLCLTVFHRGKGAVVIGGQLVQAVFWDSEVASAERFLTPPLYGTRGGSVFRSRDWSPTSLISRP
jgi:hypothetical protein